MSNLLQILGLVSPGLANGAGQTPYPAPTIPPPSSPDTAPPPIVQAPPAPNMLQALAAPPPAPPAPVDPLTRPARSRSSILDTIGRVSDVLAKVGGANALYQPTLDARQDREISLGDHARQVDLDKLKMDLSRQTLTAGEGTIADAGNARLGQAARGLKAILAANPDADVSTIWPTLAQQAGVPADRAAIVGQAIHANPSLVDGLTDAINGSTDKYTGNVVYAKGPDGKLAAFQPGNNVGARNILPEGYTPIDPAKPVDLGGSVAFMGTRTGEVDPHRILPKTERPGGAEDRRSREGIAGSAQRTARDIARGHDQTTITVAGMPARSKSGAAAKPGLSADAREALIGLKNIQTGFDDLHRMNALPGDTGGGTVGNVLSALGRGTSLGQSIGEQTGSPAAQKRLEMSKSINTLQQTLIKALPASATRTKFEQEILKASLPDPSKMSYGTAQTVISQYQDIFRRAQEAAAAESQAKAGGQAPVRSLVRPAAPSRAPARPGAPVKPSTSQW